MNTISTDRIEHERDIRERAMKRAEDALLALRRAQALIRSFLQAGCPDFLLHYMSDAAQLYRRYERLRRQSRLLLQHVAQFSGC